MIYAHDYADNLFDNEFFPKVVGTCKRCKLEIYRGETCYRIGDDLYCEDCVTEETAGDDDYFGEEE